MVKKMNNQCTKVFEWLCKGNRLSHLEATTDLGIARLAARVLDLRRQGIPIQMERVKGVNRYGDKITYGVYRIEEEYLNKQRLNAQEMMAEMENVRIEAEA